MGGCFFGGGSDNGFEPLSAECSAADASSQTPSFLGLPWRSPSNPLQLSCLFCCAITTNTPRFNTHTHSFITHTHSHNMHTHTHTYTYTTHTHTPTKHTYTTHLHNTHTYTPTHLQNTPTPTQHTPTGVRLSSRRYRWSGTGEIDWGSLKGFVVCVFKMGLCFLKGGTGFRRGSGGVGIKTGTQRLKNRRVFLCRSCCRVDSELLRLPESCCCVVLRTRDTVAGRWRQLQLWKPACECVFVAP